VQFLLVAYPKKEIRTKDFLLTRQIFLLSGLFSVKNGEKAKLNKDTI
jgi:hypothetical protein